MPVGNDVVDLQDPANQPSAIHPRFDERVFSDRELRRLGGVDELERHRLRWTLWAARESAYKYLAQREPDTPFRPAEMRVRLTGPLSGRPVGRVEWREHAVEVQADCRPDRVHVVTLAGGVPPACAVWRIVEASVEDAGVGGAATDPRSISAATRVLAGRTVARELGLRGADVRVVTPPAGKVDPAPHALHGGSALPVELSLSHDGAWIACAVLSRRRGPAAAR